MTEIWSLLPRAFEAALFALTPVCGGSLGTAIIVLSFSFRLALLPVTLRVARRAQRMQRAITALQPEFERLKSLHGSDPLRLHREMLAAYQRAGIRPLRDTGFFSTLLQLPFMAALYAVIRDGVGARGRFLWISNLARPDVLLTLLIMLSSGLVAALTPNATGSAGSRAMLVMSMLLTLLFVMRLASGIGLYWIASNAVGALQVMLLRRTRA